MTPSTPEEQGPSTPKKGKTKDVIPFGELELATLALKAADAWDASPLPALLWCSKAELRTAAVAFRASIGAADVADDDVSPAGARLAELDKMIDSSLKFVRNYLLEEHGSKSKAKAYYDTFGLMPDGKLPAARPARVASLTKLIVALRPSGYNDGKYGTAFWKPILTEYTPLATTNSDGRSSSSTETGTKNAQETPLRKMLRALRQHIKTNFPETFAAQWRGFGYLKESY
ncbi:hypothetical protein [Hymenobacter negativus]|uniref:Uncharacterized protein n=1 Tax=Hymenobacter negativus TaxID=2795026 RepID=A0ABS3QCJ8_9BACT|nr:hypothetical protein [Hymenobacter negativus]MBO2008967.1 hypothetical protein [Hymenobacter negativus]